MPDFVDFAGLCGLYGWTVASYSPIKRTRRLIRFTRNGREKLVLSDYQILNSDEATLVIILKTGKLPHAHSTGK